MPGQHITDEQRRKFIMLIKQNTSVEVAAARSGFTHARAVPRGESFAAFSQGLGEALRMPGGVVPHRQSLWIATIPQTRTLGEIRPGQLPFLYFMF